MASTRNGHIWDAFAIDRASQLTGISEAQIRRWDVDGVLSPELTGPSRVGPFSRIYSRADLVGLRVLAELRRLGVSPHQLRAAARRLPSPAHRWNRRFWVNLASNDVFLSAGEAEASVNSKGARPAIVLVDPEVFAGGLDARLAELQARTNERGLIVTDRNILGGAPIFAGTRIPVSAILEFLAEGADDETILAEYPRLTQEDLQSAREFRLHGSAA